MTLPSERRIHSSIPAGADGYGRWDIGLIDTYSTDTAPPGVAVPFELASVTPGATTTVNAVGTPFVADACRGWVVRIDVGETQQEWGLVLANTTSALTVWSETGGVFGSNLTAGAQLTVYPYRFRAPVNVVVELEPTGYNTSGDPLTLGDGLGTLRIFRLDPNDNEWILHDQKTLVSGANEFFRIPAYNTYSFQWTSLQAIGRANLKVRSTPVGIGALPL